MTNFFFYFTVLTLPIQLARHFFSNFSLISGLRSDYLAPTIYLTDIIVTILIGSYILRAIPSGVRESREVLKDSSRQARTIRDYINTPDKIYLLSFIFYLLFNSLFIAPNKWVALYKFVKILEFVFLGFAIYKLKPRAGKTVTLLSIGAFYSSLIAIWQFVTQKSIGGIFWLLGERTFFAGTPGIAAVVGPNGTLLLRPYATFSHPNVLGGFLAVVLPLVFYYSSSDPPAGGESRSSRQARTIKRFWLMIVLFLGLTALILTFSRVAWVVAFMGFFFIFLQRKIKLAKRIKPAKNIVFMGFLLLILLSVFLPLFLSDIFFSKHEYWQERVLLIKTATPMILQNLVFGVGLGNSIIRLKDYASNFPGLYIFQPIHNIYLLFLTETGVGGFIFFLRGFWKIIDRIFKSKTIFLIPVTQLLCLGLFDHYLFTLQQGQLILTIIIALAVSSQPKWRDLSFYSR